LHSTAKQAIKDNHNSFTSTLLMSPQKSQEKLVYFGNKIANEFALKFVFKDYRKNNGVVAQNKAVKDENLYRQDTCGCFFAYNKHHKHQKRHLCDMYCDIGKQILPNSIEDRLLLFKTRDSKSILFKQKFQNHRIKRAYVKKNKKILDSYFLCYSTTSKTNTKAKVAFCKDDIYYLNKDSIMMINLQYFNKIANSNYKNVKELVYNPLLFEKEYQIRAQITNKHGIDIANTSCIIVLDNVEMSDDEQSSNYEIFLDSFLFDDFRQIDIKSKHK